MSLVVDTDLGRFGRGLLALLLAGALLLCLGDFWASHACSASQGVSPTSYQALEHHPFADVGVAGHEQPWCYLRVAANYFAVLLTIFLGLILGLLFRGTRSWGTGIGPRPIERRLRTYALLRPARGPEPALTQVFRL